MALTSENRENSWIKAFVEQGDERVFRKLFETYFEPLVHFATKLTKSHEEAEGIVQEVFIKVWQNREFIDVKLSFKSYLYKITKTE